MNTSDKTPAISVGHVVLETDRMAETFRFMQNIGMRAVFEGADVSVLELRGGTHLLLMAKDKVNGGEAPFDLMVDDIHASHKEFTKLGLDPLPIEPRPMIDHEVFTLREPAGHMITIFSSHTICND